MNSVSVTDEEAATAMGGKHPKRKKCPVHDAMQGAMPTAQVLPGSPGSGAAPGANGPPTTGSDYGPGGPMGST